MTDYCDEFKKLRHQLHWRNSISDSELYLIYLATQRLKRNMLTDERYKNMQQIPAIFPETIGEDIAHLRSANNKSSREYFFDRAATRLREDTVAVLNLICGYKIKFT